MSSEATVWGRHAVLEALRAGTAICVYVGRGQNPATILAEIEQAAKEQAVPVRHVASDEIGRRTADSRSQGVLAVVRRPRHVALDEAITDVGRSTSAAFFLVLDQIQDPHNLGALVRTADTAGVHAVVVPERRSAALTGIVAKTSAGAIHHVPIVEVKNLVRAMQDIKQAGIWLAGLDGEAKTSIFDSDLSGPIGLVIGGEEDGLRRLTREHCDLLVRLPMYGRVQSLNASVAGSIAMYEVVRQRSRGKNSAAADRTVE